MKKKEIKSLCALMSITIGLTTACPGMNVLAAQPQQFYTVSKGDTLSKIAKKNHVSVKQLCQWNGIQNANMLRIGQQIKLNNSSNSVISSKQLTAKEIKVLDSLFDEKYYALINPQVVALVGNTREALFNHYINIGYPNNVQPNADFNVYAYKSAYADLQKAFGKNAYMYYFHYYTYVKNGKENRIFTTIEKANAVGIVVTDFDGNVLNVTPTVETKNIIAKPVATVVNAQNNTSSSSNSSSSSSSNASSQTSTNNSTTVQTEPSKPSSPSKDEEANISFEIPEELLYADALEYWRTHEPINADAETKEAWKKACPDKEVYLQKSGYYEDYEEWKAGIPQKEKKEPTSYYKKILDYIEDDKFSVILDEYYDKVPLESDYLGYFDENFLISKGIREGNTITIYYDSISCGNNGRYFDKISIYGSDWTREDGYFTEEPYIMIPVEDYDKKGKIEINVDLSQYNEKDGYYIAFEATGEYYVNGSITKDEHLLLGGAINYVWSNNVLAAKTFPRYEKDVPIPEISNELNYIERIDYWLSIEPDDITSKEYRAWMKACPKDYEYLALETSYIEDYIAWEEEEAALTKPNREDFESYDDYEEAHREYSKQYMELYDREPTGDRYLGIINEKINIESVVRENNEIKINYSMVEEANKYGAKISEINVYKFKEWEAEREHLFTLQFDAHENNGDFTISFENNELDENELITFSFEGNGILYEDGVGYTTYEQLAFDQYINPDLHNKEESFPSDEEAPQNDEEESSDFGEDDTEDELTNSEVEEEIEE